MIDPVTTALIGSGALVTSHVLKKLLGPTADYLGERGRDLVKRAETNLGTVLQIALEKLRNDINRPGEVNPRVFKNVWEESRFVEDVFSTEYFGGLLASARTEDGRDDSALPFVALVKSMSSYQLRLHFIIYSLVASYRPDNKRSTSSRFWNGLNISIPGFELEAAFDVKKDFEGQLLLALNGLIDQRLIEDYSLQLGGLRKGSDSDKLEEDCLIISPNERGACLFLRALGGRGLSPELITSIDVDYSLSQRIIDALEMPQHATFYYADRRNNRLSALEYQMDSLRSDLSDVSDKCDEMEDDIQSLVEKSEESDAD